MKRPGVRVQLARFAPAKSVSRSRAVLDKPALVHADTELLARTRGSGFTRLYSESFIADFEALELRAMAWLEDNT